MKTKNITAYHGSKPPQPKVSKHMKQKSNWQRKVAAEQNKRGGRSNAASHNHQHTQHPWNTIATTVETSFGISIYTETLEFAREHLSEEGQDASSLFNPKTGEPTKKGLELIEAAVEEGWQRTLNIAEQDNYDSKPVLTSLLSDRAVFDYITADLVGRGHIQSPQTAPQVTAPKTD